MRGIFQYQPPLFCKSEQLEGKHPLAIIIHELSMIRQDSLFNENEIQVKSILSSKRSCNPFILHQYLGYKIDHVELIITTLFKGFHHRFNIGVLDCDNNFF